MFRLPFSRWTNWYARRQGQRDALKDFPPANAERALGYPAEVEKKANQELHDMEQRYFKRDRRVQENIKHALGSEEATKKELDEMEREYAQHPVRTSISKFLYYFLSCFLIIGEVPLNLPAFLYFFRTEVLGAWLLALVAGFILVLCAHFVGKNLRQPKRTPTEIVGTIVATIVACAAIFGIATLRQKALETNAGGSSIGFMGFVLIQFFVFFGAAVLSYLAHDPLRDRRQKYQAAKVRVDRLRVQRPKLFEATKSQANELVEIAQFLNASYEGENVKHRSGKITGLRPIAPKVPEGFSRLKIEQDTEAQRANQLPGEITYQRGDSEVSGRY